METKIKGIVFVLLLFLLTFAAVYTAFFKYDKSVKPETVPKFKVGNRDLQIYEIDGCEYLGNATDDRHSLDMLTHRGQCKYCKIRNK